MQTFEFKKLLTYPGMKEVTSVGLAPVVRASTMCPCQSTLNISGFSRYGAYCSNRARQGGQSCEWPRNSNGSVYMQLRVPLRGLFVKRGSEQTDVLNTYLLQETGSSTHGSIWNNVLDAYGAGSTGYEW